MKHITEESFIRRWRRKEAETEHERERQQRTGHRFVLVPLNFHQPWRHTHPWRHHARSPVTASPADALFRHSRAAPAFTVDHRRLPSPLHVPTTPASLARRRPPPPRPRRPCSSATGSASTAPTPRRRQRWRRTARSRRRTRPPRAAARVGASWSRPCPWPPARARTRTPCRATAPSCSPASPLPLPPRCLLAFHHGARGAGEEEVAWPPLHGGLFFLDARRARHAGAGAWGGAAWTRSRRPRSSRRRRRPGSSGSGARRRRRRRWRGRRRTTARERAAPCISLCGWREGDRDGPGVDVWAWGVAFLRRVQEGRVVGDEEKEREREMPWWLVVPFVASARSTLSVSLNKNHGTTLCFLRR